MTAQKTWWDLNKETTTKPDEEKEKQTREDIERLGLTGAGYALMYREKQEAIDKAANQHTYFKPLDFVRTIYGSIAMVTETNRAGTSIAIHFIGPMNERDYSTWREPEELTYLTNLPLFLASSLAGRGGEGMKDVESIFKSERDK